MLNIGQDTLRGLLICAPPLELQRVVADCLDRKVAAVDAAIKIEEQLLLLLQEKRTATVTDAVTRGARDDVALKDSMANWIERVPLHWDVVRIKHVARLESGHTPSRQHPEYWIPEECTIPWISLSDVWQLRDGTQEYVRETSEKISARGLANSAARLLPAGTVILSRTASVGFSAIMDSAMATTQDFVCWICGPKIRPLYLLYVLRAMVPEFERLTMGSVHRTIYMPDVARFVTPLPPLEEQDVIVSLIRSRLAPIDAAISKIRLQIDRLREYRQALITAAVTGQIDVTKEPS